MDCWAVLGIDRTSDTTVIRKAYKQQLLVHHPEEDPEGYQNVRAAYAAAMNAAKLLAEHDEAKTGAEVSTEAEMTAKVDAYSPTEAPVDADKRGNRRLFKVGSDLLVDNSEQDGGHENEERLTVTRHFFAEQVQGKTQAENDFMARLERLYNDHGTRNDPEAWTELLSDDALWDIQVKSRIDVRMLRLFSERPNRLSDDIWKIIESHTGLFDKINREMDEYSARFVDIYALATQEITTPRSLKKARTSAEQIIKRPDISWWRYCFKIPIGWIILIAIGNFFAVPLYLLSVLVRCVLFAFRRNWKIIMWEYTFTYINRWSRRFDFKYIDIIKIVQFQDAVIIHLKGKRIRIKASSTENLGHLLAKMSRYGRKEGDTYIMIED